MSRRKDPQKTNTIHALRAGNKPARLLDIHLPDMKLCEPLHTTSTHVTRQKMQALFVVVVREVCQRSGVPPSESKNRFKRLENPERNSFPP